MATNKIPTLVIGLGGVGCRITAGLNKLLSEENKNYVGVVGIDTNVNDLTTVQKQGLKTIRISDNRNVQDYLREFPEFCEWFPVHRLLVQRGLSAGAGQIRTISRLAALAAEKRGDFRPIEDEIKRITKNRMGGTKQTLAVVITGSITGGTGAGMFLQIPYYIRNLLKNTQGIQNVVIRGMFMGPDITRNAQTSAINREAVSVNAYSCLKELNAMYMTQMYPDTTANIKLDYYDEMDRTEQDVNWEVSDEQSAEDKAILSQKNTVIPYDYLYLIEGNNKTSSIGNAAINTVEQLISRTLYTLLFTPVVNDSLSIEDNFTLQQIGNAGMSRYASSGLCRLVYPVDLAREYVVLSNAKELVNKEWRLIDHRCEEAVILAQTKKKTDGKAVIPTMAKNYCDNFEKAVCDRNAPLASLYSEAFTKNSETNEVINVAQRFYHQIISRVDDICSFDEIKSAAKACVLDTKKMENLSNAGTAISALENALDNYEALAEKTVSDNYATLVNELFPPSVVSMEESMRTGLGIYKWISPLHPVTARYFCYKLSLLLEQKIADCREGLDGLNLDVVDDTDFDTKEKEKQSPTAALNTIKGKDNFFYKHFYSDAKKTKKLTNLLATTAATQTRNITTWMEESLCQLVCEELLKRVNKLAENYKIFFDSIGTVIEINDERLKDLETLEFPIGEEGIYCSSDAFKKMASEYAAKNELSLPGETKKVIFMNVFRVTAGDFTTSPSEPEHEKQKREKESKAVLTSVFENAVLDTLRANVIKHGDSIVNLTAKQALVKEYELETGKSETYSIPEEFKAETTEYAKKKINEAMGMAEPLIAVNSSAMTDVAELVFLAVHPDTAEKVGGVSSASKTAETYFPEVTDDTGNNRVNVLMNEDFAPNEIVCVRTQYLFDIEDLVKYGPDSLNAKYYFKRISNIGGKVLDAFNADAFKTVINPHLNRNWHQEGFIPALTLPERQKSEKETFKAFVYATGLDYVSLIDSDDDYGRDKQIRIWIDNTLRVPSEIKSRGNRIGSRYIDFFKSIDFNRNMKARILKNAGTYRKQEKGYLATEELAEEILNIVFVNDLIQPLDKREQEDSNIYDIFLGMREHMPETSFKKLFDGLLDALWEFTSELFDKSPKLVNSATIQILNAIYDNCSVAVKENSNEELSYGEERLKKFHQQLLEETYHG